MLVVERKKGTGSVQFVVAGSIKEWAVLVATATLCKGSGAACESCMA